MRGFGVNLKHKKMEEKLNHLVSVYEEPYFRKMRVESGWMYNFYDQEKDAYSKNWTFVPDKEEIVKKLGLWATDRPDLIDDTKNILFEIKF